MVTVLETDLKAKLVDEMLTDLVTGACEHQNRSFIYKYKK